MADDLIRDEIPQGARGAPVLGSRAVGHIGRTLNVWCRNRQVALEEVVGNHRTGMAAAD